MTLTSHAVLMRALRAAPRRYRLPPLPADVPAAWQASTATALAFAIEAAREAALGIAPLPGGVPDLFLRRLADLVRESLGRPGDPSFQARVLQAGEPEVAEFIRLSTGLRADARTVREAVDAVAHPAKLERASAGATHHDLARLHALSRAGAWDALHEALSRCPSGLEPESHRWAPALSRLRRHTTLQHTPAVQRYLALLALAGPARGSALAATQGRNAARAGADAERASVAAFAAIARQLDDLDGTPGAHRAVRGLLPPHDLPGESEKAKGEWDAAILRSEGPADPASIVLLAEVKASPAAATRDFARLRRGLQRFALAEPGRAYRFGSAAGEQAVAGDTLRALAPVDRALPPSVIYCCTAAPEAQPALLAAASQAVLLAEPASVAFALALARGEAPAPALLAPVWQALPVEPRLKSALHQDETARAAREVMLHPDDLLAAFPSPLSSRA